jgi:SAM-dependent methyltransferase
MVHRARTTSPERFLFGSPLFYRLKHLVIEKVIWRGLLGGVLRFPANPLPDLAALYAGKRVLLAACGPGNVTTGPSLASAAEIVAFDLSPEFARACKANHPDWEVFSGDIHAIPYPDGAFDVAVVYSSLHHIGADAGRVVEELARVTRDRIVVVEGVVPTRGPLRTALLVWYGLVDGGVHYYTRSELLDVFARAGLRLERVSEHGPIRHMMLAVATKDPASAPARR